MYIITVECYFCFVLFFVVGTWPGPVFKIRAVSPERFDQMNSAMPACCMLCLREEDFGLMQLVYMWLKVFDENNCMLGVKAICFFAHLGSLWEAEQDECCICSVVSTERS